MSAVAVTKPGSRVLHRTRVIYVGTGPVGTGKQIVTRCTEQRVFVIWLSREAAAQSWGRAQDCADCEQHSLVATS